MQAKKTALIILNYNNYEDTINCVESVQQYNTAPIKIIVVDNGSKREGTLKALDAHLAKTFLGEYKQVNEGEKTSTLPYVTFLTSKTNDGYACGNNKGLKLAYADDEIDKVMILNNDVLFVEDIVPQLVREYDTMENVGIISPLLYKKDMDGIDYNCARRCESVCRIMGRLLLFYVNPFQIKTKWNKQQKYLLDQPELMEVERFEIELPSGSCMLLGKRLFEEIGSFDPNTFLYYEENILYQKLHARGLTNYIYPNLKCIHLGASSTKKEVGYFMIKASADSACYYIEHYTNASMLTKCLFRIYIYKVLLPLVKLQKKIKTHRK